MEEQTTVSSSITTAVNRAFVMGANYQRLKTLDTLYSHPEWAPFVDGLIEMFDLKKELTDADVFANSDD